MIAGTVLCSTGLVPHEISFAFTALGLISSDDVILLGQVGIEEKCLFT